MISDIQKRKKSNNKSSECILDLMTYPLYKYNIGIDYHHIKNRDEKSHIRKSRIIKVANGIQIR